MSAGVDFELVTPNGGETEPNHTSPEYRITALEHKLDTLAWLYAELAHRQLSLATAMAALLAQQAQPQVQQAILKQLIGG